MFKSVTKYLIVFVLSIIFSLLFHEKLIQLKLIPKGFVKLIFPETKIKPKIKKIENNQNEIINANSFELEIEKIEYFSGYNIDENGKMNSQHKSAALYAFEEDNITKLELYTRDGFIITKEGVNQFELPNYYDSHNSQGGIRGIFYLDSHRYAYMASLKIGCQNMSIINLNLNKEIFETDCLPNYEKVHYDGVGGASLHTMDSILLSIGAPTNNNQIIRDLSQNDKSYYGKIISIDKKSIQTFLKNEGDIKIKIFSKGHRNPQGIAKLEYNFFSSEHGPKGGDEINKLIEGENYGWPITSYGTKYESLAIASYKLNHFKNNMKEPLIQFTPSIAISDLTNCSNKMMEYYERKGCLIGTTLRDQSLIIVLLDNDMNRIIGFEKIEFGQRLRHIAKNKNGELFEEEDGSIYVTSDSGEVLKVIFKLLKE